MTSGCLTTSTSNRPITLSAVLGNADAAFRDADYVRRERFVVQRHSAIPMEPRGLLAEWDAAVGRLTVWGACKVPFAIRRVLAKHLGLAIDAIRIVENDTGGSFGVRGEYYPEDCLIPFAARLVGRPVKWIEDRREHFLSTNHARDMACDVEMSLPTRWYDSRNTRPRLRGYWCLHSYKCGHAAAECCSGYFWALQRPKYSI